ncbi:Holliday junction branch migration protein RuvA [Microbacterium sp. G2-8]|uniref:Holliday junction branch migration protein RuvA n=1 Tax=Microbacterium sp. G2-8 TaxID=2842454 RepID=UPI001C8A03ED|nr:Holliday junction branch migration protein RuvA [Microbacterium sp. G2-8]
MISSLRGTVLHAGSDQVIVEVTGVGFTVAVPTDVARTAREGEPVFLHTHLVVREDAMNLFGFASREELDVFGTLLGVSGVGPKSALGVLSSLTIDQIAAAVQEEDDKPFRKVSGIGPKTAKLIALQLQGKLDAPAAAPTAQTAPALVVDQVVQALAGLGWPDRVASDTVARVSETASASDRDSVQALLRLTLAALGPAQPGGARG